MDEKVLRIRDWEFGEVKSGYMLLQKVEERRSERAIWCDVELCDGENVIKAKCWKTKKDEFGMPEKSVIRVAIVKEMYGGNPSYVLRDYESIDCESVGLIPADFAIRAPMDSEEMFEQIQNILQPTFDWEMIDSLGQLAINILDENKEKLMRWSAAESIHHNMYGGLLYHTLRMLQLGKVLLTVYPSLDEEVLLAAICLHDIGKLKELDTDVMGIASYTVDGQLFGHAHIGMNMVEEEAKKGHYNQEKVKCLCHCIASHHGKLEWGAIVPPHTMEASVLHYIDLIDSRIQQFETQLDLMEPGSCSESKVFGLDNVKVYKPFV